MRQNKRRHNRQSGNAFFIVMVGIVLFAALMFTFSRGARQGGDQLTGRQATIAATDILSYAQLVERGVNRAYGKTRSENNISFENDFIADYDNVNCPGLGATCRVFGRNGGGANWSAGDEYANGGAPWIFSGHNTILGVGADANADLVMILPGLKQAVCEAINDTLNVATLPVDNDGIERTTKFQGSFNNAEQISNAAVTGVLAACVQDTDAGDYFYYHVLLPR